MQINLEHRWILTSKKLLPQVLALSNAPNDTGKKFIELIGHLLIHKGEAETIRLLKSYRNIIQRSCMGLSIEPIPFHKSDKGGFPKVLYPWKSMSIGSEDEKRIAISIWRIVEEFKAKPNSDYNSITEQMSHSSKENLVAVIPEFRRVAKRMQVFKNVYKLEPQLVLSNKAGPNGPSVLSLLKDLSALSGTRLFEAILELLTLQGSELMATAYITSKPQGNYSFGKVVSLPDKACKTRHVAIGDWFTQTALFPYHKDMMKRLRTMRNDSTYDQNEVQRRIQIWKLKGLEIYTSDATAFTDRLPRELNVILLQIMYGQRTAELWLHLMTDRVWNTPHGDIKYAVGNPMGLLSSWASSALVHHVLVRLAMSQVGVKLGTKQHQNDYLLLGDDIMMTNSKVFKRYQQLLEGFGMTLNPSKSTSSKDGSAEFAKRNFFQGKEITGIPVGLLPSIEHRPEQLIELLRMMLNRGYQEKLTPFVFLRYVDLLRLSSRKKSQIFRVLMAPEPLGYKPHLWLCTELENPWLDSDNNSEIMAQAIIFAKRQIFTDLAKGIIEIFRAKKTGTLSAFGDIPEDHPIMVEIGKQIMLYLSHGESEYSIFEAWLQGEDQNMIHIPMVRTYAFHNNGHKRNKAKFDLINLTHKYFTHGIPEESPIFDPVTNFELFEFAFSELAQGN